MKKFFTLLTVTLLSLLSLASIFTACAPSNQTAGYVLIDTTYWKNVYIVGEEVDLSGLSLLYYPDVEDQSNCEDVDITKNMVKGFDTSTAGKKQMTVEYNGLKTETIDYVVFEDFEFSVNQTFCLGDNVLVKLNTQTNKATVTKYSSLTDLISNNATPVELDLDVIVKTDIDDQPYKVCVFTFENRKYTYSTSGGIHTFNILEQHGESSSSSSFNVQPFDQSALVLPTINTNYQSEGGNKKAVAIFDQTYGVKIYIVDHSVTDLSSVEPDYVLDGSLATLSRMGKITYVKATTEYSINVALNSRTELIITKNPSERYTCTLVQD